MKQLKFLIALVFASFFFTDLKSQYCGTATTNVAITPTTTSQLTPSYSSGRRAFRFTATAGCVYEFSTCGQTTGNTYLRLYSTGTGGTLLDQNDDFCGTQSTITWTATVSGTVSVLLTRSNCNNLNFAVKMSYRRISCNPPPCTTPISPLNNVVDAFTNQTLSWNPVAATSYDVYFGTNPNPPFVSNQITTTYNPGTLTNSTTYYWKIVPKNSNGAATGCSIWTFTTTDPGCTNAPYGQYPSTIYNPSCAGSTENITTVGYAGEYSVVSVINGVNYTYSSSNAADFITITDDLGGIRFVYGTGSVSWTATYDGTVRFYTHTDDFCGTSTASRARRVQCSTPPPPANDLCANAIDVGCGGTFTGNTTFATIDGPDCDYNPFENWNAPGVWYKVVGNGQTITASLCGSSYDTKIFAYTGSCGNLTCLTADDDYCSLQSQISFTSTNNTTYYILVTGYGTRRGNFTLNVDIAPSPPIITTQPVSQTICAGESVTFSVAASGVQMPFTYQWYHNNNPIPNATGTSITATLAGNYYVTIKNNCIVSINSNTVTLTVNAIPNVTINPTTASYNTCNPIPVLLQASGATSYSWSNGGQTSQITVVPSATTTYTVTGTTNGCSDTASAIVTISGNGGGGPLGSTGPIRGPSYICDAIDAGYAIKYEIDSVPGASSYIWSVPQNVLIVSGQGTTQLMVMFTTGYIPDTISVVAQNSCNFTTASYIFVSITQTPTIVGELCGNAGTNKTYIVTNTDPNATYTWTVPYGAVILSGQGNDTVVVKYSPYFIGGIITVSGTTDCGDVYAETGNIILSASIPTIQGNATLCAGTMETYSVDPIPTATHYQWGVPNGVTIINGQFTESLEIYVSPTFISGSLTVMASNHCGSSPMAYFTITNQNVGTTPGPISGPTDLCPYLGTTATYSVAAQPNTVIFTWSVPNGTTIASGQGSNSIVLNIPTTFTPGLLSVSRNNGCGISSASTLTLTTVQNTIAVSNITGPTNVCNYVGANTIATYSISPVNGGQYNWTVPFGAIIMSGQSTNSVGVKFLNNYGGGTISVVVSSYCGNPVTKSITASSATYTIPSIAGTKCIDNGFVYTYSVTPINGALSYNWTAPGNASVVSGQGTNIVTVSYPSNFEATSCINNMCDSIKLSVTFGCGVRTTGRPIGLTTFVPNTVIGPLDACGPDTINLSITPVMRATSYTWNKPNGTSIIHPVTGNLVSTIVGNYTSINVKINTTFLGGNFSVQSSNQCGSTAMRYHTVSKDCPAVRQISDTTYLEDLLDEEWKKSLNEPLNFIVFPNPGKGVIELRVYRGTAPYYLVRIVDKLGKVVYSALKESTDRIDLNHLSAGFYYITLIDPNTNTLTKEIIISE